MKNIMFCSCGRRVQLFKFLKDSLGDSCKIIATDNQSIAPALYAADEHYLTPRIDDPNYINTILKIAKDNDVKAITTLIDPEIELLAKNRDRFEAEGIIVLAPSKETAAYCFDKYEMFRYLEKNNIRTVLTYDSLENFKAGYKNNEITFPVFIKPRTGSGSVGIHKCTAMNELENYFSEGKFDYIIQEFMDCEDCDADVYIDCYSHKPVAAFSKNKLETKIGGASKTISFKDQKLFDFIEEICQVLEFNGPVDMDFWYKDGKYYLSEVNPRFGGAYLHAYGAGVDFFKLIQNNMEGNVNESIIGKYDDDVLMMMYDSVVIVSKDKLVK
ncbi:ATP-grasp domain-containing protein [Prevotella sp.]|uniref:ATP-grasp domain-containing protein n=1 Tax=Prevotella sp. TaxID=59823 RepID=UPI001CB10962|nr:ATP-grasp domain-containing protein [Prevotella sp.]MBF1639663.1 ATP-grasp domain-containing protein [Prevotella sp.]